MSGPVARLPLRDLLGRGPDVVRERLGDPTACRRAGDDRWLVYRRPDLVLRVRCRDGAVASWTLSFRRGRDSLREAVEPLGLWPACGPDVEAAEARIPLVRRPLPAGGRGREHSLTATLRGGCVIRVTAFDEAPEWL